jgi:hypothetical protein
MQEFGVVALSAVAGVLFAALFVGVGAVIYYSRCTKIQAALLVQECKKFSAENGAALEQQRVQLSNIAESAKSNLTSTRQDVKAALEANAKAIAATLEDHRRQMDAIANKINANALLEASRRGVEACARLERVASSLWKWAERLDQEQPDEPVDTGEWTEERANEYAPESSGGKTIYEKARPEDLLTGEESVDRVPVGL